MFEQIKSFMNHIATAFITLFFAVLFVFLFWWTGWIDMDIKRPVRGHNPGIVRQQGINRKIDIDGYSKDDRDYMQSILNNIPGGI